MNIEIGFWEVVLTLVMFPVMVLAVYYLFQFAVVVFVYIAAIVVGLFIVIFECLKKIVEYLSEFKSKKSE